MHEKLTHNEIHSLYVIHLLVVAGKCSENISEANVALFTLFKERIQGECTTKISFDLGGGNGLRVKSFQTLEMIVALLKFLHNCLLYLVTLRF